MSDYEHVFKIMQRHGLPSFPIDCEIARDTTSGEFVISRGRQRAWLRFNSQKTEAMAALLAVQ